MSFRTIIYLALPRVTRSFELQIIGEDAGSAELSGPDVFDAELLLRMASGVARFDVEHNGRVFRECRLSGMQTEDTIPFTFERVRDVDANSAPGSTPPASSS